MRSVQTRVLILSGAGVFVAAVALALLGESSLRHLERQLIDERQRLASVVASGLNAIIEDELTRLADAAARGALVPAAPDAEVDAAGADAVRLQRPIVREAGPSLILAVPYRSAPDAPPQPATTMLPVTDARVSALLAPEGTSVRAAIARGDCDRSANNGRACAPIGHTGLFAVFTLDGRPMNELASFRRRSAWIAIGLGALALLLASGIGVSLQLESKRRDLEVRNARLGERERWRARLLRDMIAAQENERKRIARELHDDTSQTVAALGMGVDAALNMSQPGTVADKLRELRGLVSRMHTELARIIVNLRPSVLDDLGLAAAIGWLADRLRATGVTVHCELEGIEARLSPEIETALFRAVQEALSNIARHARAETVLIQGVRRGDHITFEIEDDGIGFETGTAVEGLGSMRGVGLLGMRERIEIIGGTLAIESEPGSGTRVVMNVPTETA